MNTYFLILDIETTGFPENWDRSLDVFDNYHKIIEIAWQLYDNKKFLLNQKTLLIRPNGYEITPEIEKLTGISFEEAIEKGTSLMNALLEFKSILNKFNPIIIAHNCEYDINVIQTNLIKNNISLALFEYKHICTMKKSISFCNLPNLKYPKLSELYEILFQSKPSESHRALPDVIVTSKSFFKLLELGIIELNQLARDKPIDIESIKIEDIKKAIKSYISDINKFPIFYNFEDTSTISDKSAVNEVLEIFNKFYQTSKAKTFEIPYNLVINRLVTSLKTKDIIVRYILINHLKKNTNFISSIEKYDEDAINRFSELQLNDEKRIIVKVDITNCYESIEHNQLVDEISNDLNLPKNSLYSTILYNSLKVIYEDFDGNIKRKEKGLLIGSKPDEFLAEYFLEKIAINIQKKGIDVFRVADEFIFYSESIDSARKNFKLVKDIIESYNLEINNSKTTVTDHREDNLKNQFDFKLVMKGATYPYLVYELSDIAPIENTLNKSNSHLSYEKEINQEINSYDSALSFLKRILVSQNSIEKYQKNYPKYKYLNNIVFSQPTDFRNDFYDIDKSIFSKSNVEKIKKIIAYYPKSEYYTALAIQALTFLAKNSILTIDRMDLENEELSGFDLKQHESCIESNLAIIDLLRSNEVHEYQKYILLRSLFKKKDDLTLDLNEYEIKEVRHYFFDDLELQNKIPFKDKIFDEINLILTKTNYYPLKMICSEIKNLNKL